MNYEDYLGEIAASGAISKVEFERAIGIIKSQTYPQTVDTLYDVLKQVGFSEGHRVIVMMLLMPEGHEEAFTHTNTGELYMSPRFDAVVQTVSDFLA